MRFVVLLLLVTMSVLGCHREERLALSEATLEGTITYKSKPVPHALVVAIGAGISAQTYADKDGKFKLEQCPAGAIKLGINTDAGRGNMMGAVMSAQMTKDKSAAPVFVDVPKKYFDPSTSGIVAQVNDPKGVTQFEVKID